MERTYLEVKVSFLHIVVLLIGVIVIGSFLFYLGYQAGKSSSGPQSQDAELLESSDNAEEIQLADVAPKTPKNNKSDNKPSIKDELQLHQLPSSKEQPAPPPSKSSTQPEKVKTKPISREPYYSVQVGAFADYTNAKKYSDKFANMNYPSEILSTTSQGNRKLFRVRVGHYTSLDEAKKAKSKLEAMEKKKFQIVKAD